MQFHLNYLHPDASLWYTTHQYPQLNNLFHGMQDEDPEAGQQAFATANALLDTEPRFFHNIKSHAITLWPITVKLHWVALILHIADPIPTPSLTTTTTIAAAAIADPEHNPTTTAFIWNRLQVILSPARGFHFASAAPQPLWYPRQTDGFSCGLRVYDIMKTMVSRVNELALGRSEDCGLWADLSADFQPDRVRAEMIGIVGVEALRAVGWPGRLMLAPCEAVGDGCGSGAVSAGESENCTALATGRLSYEKVDEEDAPEVVLDLEMVDVVTWVEFRDGEEASSSSSSQSSTSSSSSLSSTTWSTASEVSFIAVKKRKQIVKQESRRDGI